MFETETLPRYICQDTL